MHLPSPKNVFTSQRPILEFFEALYLLHSGAPDRYLSALKRILE